MMNPPSRIYVRPVLVGMLGMLAGMLVSKGFDYYFPSEKRELHFSIFVLPWLFATITAINIGYKAGVEDEKRKK